MPFRQADPLRIFEFESLRRPGLIQAVFTRRGGVSPEPWRSLNVGGTVGDDRERVVRNRLRCFAALGRDPGSIHDVWQVHSAEVVQASAPRGEGALVQADALITDNPAVTLFMRFADCVPILLFDPDRPAVGLVHAGWLGTVRQAARAAVRAMRRAFGSEPGKIVAAIGPSIGPDHYAVGNEVIDQLKSSLGTAADAHLHPRDGRTHLDLWSANVALLVAEGVRAIEVAGECTACNLADWFSHRAEGGRTGRFGGLIALEG